MDAEHRKCRECMMAHARALFEQARVQFGDRAQPSCADASHRESHPSMPNAPRPPKHNAQERADAKARDILGGADDCRGGGRGVKRKAGGSADGGDELGSTESECERILSCSERALPLAVLGLSNDRPPTLDAVRKRYRQLAMRLHPDKCRLLGAEEAMKRVNNAVRALGAHGS